LVCQECRVPNYSESVKCSKHQIIRVYVLSVDLWFSITISRIRDTANVYSYVSYSLIMNKTVVWHNVLFVGVMNPLKVGVYVFIRWIMNPFLMCLFQLAGLQIRFICTGLKRHVRKLFSVDLPPETYFHHASRYIVTQKSCHSNKKPDKIWLLPNASR